ncbi:MAG TPA: CTAG/PCC1 family protein [Nitrososphaera sp.]|nr:CTAG/PCC1 family protein [Nitrososphaera sp.]
MILNMLQHPDVSVSARIEFGDRDMAKTVLNALIPDNVNLPEGLSLKMLARGPKLFIKVQGTRLPAEVVVSTLDEILEHISVCQKVMQK